MRFRPPRSALALLPVLLFLSWTIIIYQFTPTEIADAVGTKNGYLAALVLSFIGGLSVLVGIPYHLIIMTLAAGGLNPFLLGLASSLGQFAGDTTSYALGYSGTHVIPAWAIRIMDRFRRWCTDRPYWQMAGALFLYGALCPFSNDWILIPMGLARYSYRQVMVPLELGNVVFNTGAALLGAYGLSSVLGA